MPQTLKAPLASRLSTAPESITLSLFPGPLDDEAGKAAMKAASELIAGHFENAGLEPMYQKVAGNHPDAHRWVFQAPHLLLRDILRRVEDSVPEGAHLFVKVEKTVRL